jgi:hypothetical protein
MRSCRSIDNGGEYEVLEVRGERVDAVIRESVLLMKLDVEGFEPAAFQSAKGILDAFRCEQNGDLHVSSSHLDSTARRHIQHSPSCADCTRDRTARVSHLHSLGLGQACMMCHQHGCEVWLGRACARRMDHIILEYSPGVYDVGRRWDEYLDWPAMLI